MSPSNRSDGSRTATPPETARQPVPPTAPRRFAHRHAAHCESGVTSALLADAGLTLSEPMAFGIGSGLFFFHAPFVKVTGFPLTSFRSYPGTIFRKVCRRLGVPYVRRTYRRRDRAMAELDALLARGRAVGLQANIHWLPYFPPEFRSQFNGHNLIATGVADGLYEISDPVLEVPVTCPAEALARARFSTGPLAPRGLAYYPVGLPPVVDVPGAVRRGIRDTCRQLLHTPLPWIGVRGVRHLARRVASYPRTIPDPRRRRLTLAFLLRMQEEVGTGGAGFRFMYAAFLQEAGRLLDLPALEKASGMMTAAGDLWRGFGAAAARLIKERDEGEVSHASLARMLEEIACREAETLRFLRAQV